MYVNWEEKRPKGSSTIVPIRAILTLLIDLFLLRISHINDVELLSFSESENGEFTNINLSKTYTTLGLTINTKNRNIKKILSTLYLKVAFGNTNKKMSV